MLAAIAALFWRPLWARRQNALHGLQALLLTLLPLLYFKLFDPRDVDRFALIGIVEPGASWSQMGSEFFENYELT